MIGIGKMTNALLIVVGLIEFIFRVALTVLFIATLVGIFVIGDAGLDAFIVPYLWRKIK